MSVIQLSNHQKSLTRRYLIWCYKTTKEDLDRIDRYFTQEIVDQHILESLQSDDSSDAAVDSLVNDFKENMSSKTHKALKNKFVDGNPENALQSNYSYLKNRFVAIEKSIVEFLGEEGLIEISNLYEDEMTRRILEAREHV